MKITILTPAPPGSRLGNRITALRWARMLRDLGHRVRLSCALDDAPDLLIALHAKRSASGVERFADAHPDRPLVVALTGTDLYRDLPRSRAAQRALDRASAVIALQPAALAALAPRWRHKTHVILQSVEPLRSNPPPRRRSFDVCVVGHLREVKDPMRPALASRLLPPGSRIAVVQVGAALEERFADAARREMDRNARYCWLGERPRWQARRLVARSRLALVPSLIEGGSHAAVEALVAGTPLLASAIDGNVGQLGEGYPGLFPPRDTAALADLMLRAERDARFLAQLARWCRRLRPRFEPARERAALARLLRALGAGTSQRT